jgi:hypothetical protein
LGVGVSVAAIDEAFAGSAENPIGLFDGIHFPDTGELDGR